MLIFENIVFMLQFLSHATLKNESLTDKYVLLNSKVRPLLIILME